MDHQWTDDVIRTRHFCRKKGRSWRSVVRLRPERAGLSRRADEGGVIWVLNAGSFVTLNGDWVASGSKEIPSSDRTREEDRTSREDRQREKERRRNSSGFFFGCVRKANLRVRQETRKVKTSWRTAGWKLPRGGKEGEKRWCGAIRSFSSPACSPSSVLKVSVLPGLILHLLFLLFVSHYGAIMSYFAFSRSLPC